MENATYDPSIFEVQTIEDARKIILTDEQALKTDDRWVRETPYLVDLIGQAVPMSAETTMLDYGCGIGRLSEALLSRFGCRSVGVDISASMRAYASYLQPSPRFFTCAPDMLDTLTPGFDLALCIWVLQHCLNPADEIAKIKSLLKPGGFFFVVNEAGRAVPTRERGWVHDGVDVRRLLHDNFQPVHEARLDPAVVSEPVSQRTFWGAYRKV